VEQVARLLATSELFQVFGIGPVLVVGSRSRRRDWERHRGVLGHGFWRRWFGGDPGVLGRQLAVQDGSLTIVGVAPGVSIGSMEPEVFTAADRPANPASTGSRAFQCYGRLRHGVSLDAPGPR
jgi:hypothetical protein